MRAHIQCRFLRPMDFGRSVSYEIQSDPQQQSPPGMQAGHQGRSGLRDKCCNCHRAGPAQHSTAQHSTMTLQLPADSLAGCRGHVDWAATGTEDRWRFWEAIGLRPPSAKRCCLSPPVARDFRVGELAYRKKYLDNPTVQSFNNGSAEWFKSIDRGKSWGWKGSGPWNTTDIC